MSRVLPILFNTEMVRAILDERKTVSRRVIKNLPEDAEFGGWLLDSTCQEDAKDIGKAGFKTLKQQTEKAGCIFVKPPCVAGDILYVRESVFQGVGHYLDVSGEAVSVLTYDIEYYADGLHETDHWKDKYERVWMHRRPSIYMPKEAARIFLRVTDVRVERLQDITEEQAEKEGIHYDKCPSGFTWKQKTSMVDCYTSAVGAFGYLWNSTIKKSDLEQYGWAADPWVWVIEFERCEKPEGFDRRIWSNEHERV